MDKRPLLLFPKRSNYVVEASEEEPILEPFFRGEVPLPPSTNKAYTIIYIGDQPRIGPSSELKQFKKDAASTLLQADIDQQALLAIREAKCKVPLAVGLTAYFETMWRRDLDGIIKFSIDAVFEFIGLNDRLVVELDNPKKLVDRTHPRVEVTIRTVIIR